MRVDHPGRVINRDETRLRKIEQLEEFLNACGPGAFTAACEDGERYGHISRVLLRFDSLGRNKRERGVLLRFLQHTSGYSRAQVTRLVARWQRNRLAPIPLRRHYRAPSVPFARKYTPADVALRVEMDKAHEDVCDPAMACLLQRAYRDYDDARYERMAQLSVSPLYNLRKSNGDQDGMKGVYHITCVDAVSQGQVEACVEGISEAYLLPVLAQIIAQFPFVVAGFHSDSGSKTIYSKVAKLLEKLRIEQTKSRSRQSKDNALAESKNIRFQVPRDFSNNPAMAAMGNHKVMRVSGNSSKLNSR